eukprot:CFRG1880T1
MNESTRTTSSDAPALQRTEDDEQSNEQYISDAMAKIKLSVGSKSSAHSKQGSESKTIPKTDKPTSTGEQVHDTSLADAVAIEKSLAREALKKKFVTEVLEELHSIVAKNENDTTQLVTFEAEDFLALRKGNAIMPERGYDFREHGEASTALELMEASMKVLICASSPENLKRIIREQAGDMLVVLQEYLSHYLNCLDGIMSYIKHMEKTTNATKPFMKKENGSDEACDDETASHLNAGFLVGRVKSLRLSIYSFRKKWAVAIQKERTVVCQRIDDGLANALDKELEHLIAELVPTQEEEDTKEGVRLFIEQTLQHWLPGGKVLLFGSSMSGLGFKGCDLDMSFVLSAKDLTNQPALPTDYEEVNESLYKIDVRDVSPIKEETTVPGEGNDEEVFDNVVPNPKPIPTQTQSLSAESKVIMAMKKIFSAVSHDSVFIDILAIPKARVPIIKFIHAKTGYECDICINNTLAVQNTALLRLYANFDVRSRKLMLAIKWWAKRRGINNSAGGTLSSYAYVIMVIHFLQNTSRLPVLPNLQDSRLCRDASAEHADGAVFCEDMKMAKRSMKGTNSSSLSELMAEFFCYYAFRFNISEYTISVRTPHLRKRDYRASTQKRRWRVTIEDPFETNHDLGSVLFDIQGMVKIISEFTRACYCIHQGAFVDGVAAEKTDMQKIKRRCDKCADDNHSSKECALDSKTCRNCNKEGHIVAQCPEVPSVGMSSCFKCGKRGHWARNCEMICFNCAKYGHISRECPQVSLNRGNQSNFQNIQKNRRVPGNHTSHFKSRGIDQHVAHNRHIPSPRTLWTEQQSKQNQSYHPPRAQNHDGQHKRSNNHHTGERVAQETSGKISNNHDRRSGDVSGEPSSSVGVSNKPIDGMVYGMRRANAQVGQYQTTIPYEQTRPNNKKATHSSHREGGDSQAKAKSKAHRKPSTKIKRNSNPNTNTNTNTDNLQQQSVKQGAPRNPKKSK